jgi:hypothetical protein
MAQNFEPSLGNGGLELLLSNPSRALGMTQHEI